MFQVITQYILSHLKTEVLACTCAKRCKEKQWCSTVILDQQACSICILNQGSRLDTYTYLLTPRSTVLLEKLTGFAANQEIPRILWNPKVHYRTHKRPPQTRHTLQYFTGDRMLVLPLITKRCFDRDSWGRVHHIWAQLAEETFRLLQMSLTLHCHFLLFAVRWLFSLYQA